MRIVRSRSDVGAEKGTPQVDVQEYAYSVKGNSEMGGDSQVVDDCEVSRGCPF